MAYYRAGNRNLIPTEYAKEYINPSYSANKQHVNLNRDSTSKQSTKNFSAEVETNWYRTASRKTVILTCKYQILANICSRLCDLNDVIRVVILTKIA